MDKNIYPNFLVQIELNVGRKQTVKGVKSDIHIQNIKIFHILKNYAPFSPLADQSWKYS